MTFLYRLCQIAVHPASSVPSIHSQMVMFVVELLNKVISYRRRLIFKKMPFSNNDEGYLKSFRQKISLNHEKKQACVRRERKLSWMCYRCLQGSVSSIWRPPALPTICAALTFKKTNTIVAATLKIVSDRDFLHSRL